MAVCFLFSFLNPEHERRMGEALRAALPGVDVSLSCEVQPEFREYERLSTTVLNAFLQPVAGRYMTPSRGGGRARTPRCRHRHLPVLGRADVDRARGRDADPHRAVGPRRGRRRCRGGRRARPAAAISSRSTWAAPRPTSAWSATARPRWRSGAASLASRCGCRPSISTPSGPGAGPSLTSGATA